VLHLGSCSPESITWLYRLGAREVAVQSDQKFDGLDVQVIHPKTGWKGLGSESWDIVLGQDLGALIARDRKAPAELPKLLNDKGLLIAVLPTPGDQVGLDMLTHDPADPRLDYSDVVAALEPHFDELSAMAQVPVLAYLMTGTSDDPEISFDGRLASLEDEAPTYHILCASQQLPEDLGNRLTTISFDSLSERVGKVVNSMQHDLHARETLYATRLEAQDSRVAEIEETLRALESSRADDQTVHRERLAAAEARITDLTARKQADQDHQRELELDNTTLRQRVVSARVELERRSAARHRSAQRCKRLSLEAQRQRLDVLETQGRLRQVEWLLNDSRARLERQQTMPTPPPSAVFDERLRQELLGAVAQEEVLHDELRSLKTDLQAAKELIGQQEQVLAEREAQLQEANSLRAEKEAVQRVVEAQRSLAEERGEALREQKIALRDLRNSEAALKARALDLTTELSNLRGRQSELEQAFEADCMSRVAAEEDAARHAATAENLRDVVNTLRQSLSELRGDTPATPTSATGKPTALTLEIERQRASYSAALAALAEQGRELDALDRSNAELRLELQRARAARTALGEAGDKQGNRQALQARLSAALRERATLEEEVFTLRPLRRITEHQASDLARTTGQVEASAKRQAELEREIRELRPRAQSGDGFSVLQEAHTKLVEEVTHLRAARDQAVQQAEAHSRALKAIVTEHEVAMAAHKTTIDAQEEALAKLASEIEAATTENDLLARRLAETTDHAEAVAASANADNQHLIDDLDRQKKRIVELEDEVSKTKDLIEAARNAAGQYEKESADYQAEAKGLQTSLTAVRNEADQAHLELVAAGNATAQAQVATNAAQAEVERLTEELVTSATLRNDLEHRASTLEARLDTQAAERATDRARVKAYEDGTAEPEILAIRDAEINRLRVQLEDTTGVLQQQNLGLHETQQTIQNLLETQRELQQAVSEAEKSRASQTAALAAERGRVEELQTALDRAQTDRQQAQKTLTSHFARHSEHAEQRAIEAEASGRSLAELESARAGEWARRETSLQHTLDEALADTVELRQQLAGVQAERETSRRLVHERDAEITELRTLLNVAHREQDRAAETMNLSHTTDVQALIAGHQTALREEQTDRYSSERAFTEELDTLRRSLEDAQREERQMARLLDERENHEREQWHLVIARRTARLVELADRLETVAATQGAIP
jgi:chromosome segregation ATPase